MNFNLKCDDFKQEIIKKINNSQLPITIIYYIIKDLFNQIEKQYYGTINELKLQNQKIETLEVKTEKVENEQFNQNV